MVDVGQDKRDWPECAIVFGASGAVGSALCLQLLNRGVKRIHAGTRGGDVPDSAAIHPFFFDLDDENSISSAASDLDDASPDLIFVATGALTLDTGDGPERSYRRLDEKVMERIFRLNTIGPAMIAKHFLPLLPRDRRSVFAALSARVGSISDNRLGGWHSYRASKAALNMLLRNFAIELSRTHKRSIVVGLHPGTVDSRLSRPFQANLPDGQLTAPEEAAADLLDVLCRLEPDQSGHVFDYAGKRVPD